MAKPANPHVIEQLMNDPEDPLTEDYIRNHYGIPDTFTGQALHDEAARIQEQQNREWNARKATN